MWSTDTQVSTDRIEGSRPPAIQLPTHLSYHVQHDGYETLQSLPLSSVKASDTVDLCPVDLQHRLDDLGKRNSSIDTKLVQTE